MIQDHPLRKDFTIEEAAILAAELSKFDSIHRAENSPQSSKITDALAKAKLFEKILLSAFTKGKLDIYIDPAPKTGIPNANTCSFTRTSLAQVLKEHGYDWEAFHVKSFNAFSAPRVAPTLLNDNESKQGFTAEEISLMVFNIRHASKIEDISRHFHIAQSNKLESDSPFQAGGKLTDIVYDRTTATKQDDMVSYGISVLSELRLLKDLIEKEVLRIISGETSLLEILLLDRYSKYPEINLETTTLTRKSIHDYFFFHNLRQQAQLFIPYEEKVKKFSSHKLRNIKAKEDTSKHKHSDIIENILDEAIIIANKGGKRTQGECFLKYQSVLGNDADSKSTFCRAMKPLLTQKSYYFDSSQGLQPIHTAE
ncbi:hypothetical protein ACPV5T_04590 [Vibrio astriarenae]